jgi:FK506-binding nuclear protein
MSFWGLVIEPNKLYSQTVPCSYKVTMAVLGSDNSLSEKDQSKSSETSVVLVVNENEFKICKLSPIRHDQQNLDMVLQAGAKVDFKVVGEKPVKVHLTGYYLGELPPEDEDEDIDEGEFVSEEDELVVSEQEPPKKNKRPASFDKENDDGKNKKAKTMEEKPAQKPITPTPENSKTTTPEKKKLSAEKEKQPVQDASDKQSPKQYPPDGLQIQDIKVGEGAKAKKGRKIGITYKGTLSNGKVFDETKGDDIFYFTVGKREVVPGMDIGVQDMTLGGVRRLTISPALGYGDKTQSKIPPNSTLTFEVKLVKVDTKKN